ncbi:MAG: FAD-dependent thymidylate synthase [Simkaniaceae bacterium]
MENYEDFTESQCKILKQYVTNTESNIFVLRNLPEVIKGALFSRYSRSVLGLRSLLLKDFILNEETAFGSIAGHDSTESGGDSQMVAIKKAQNFYDRILDGYGDDSIGELGGAHLAVENISMMAAKVIEDCRIGGSPLEKSTRYIYFDQKVKGEYLFYREPVIMTSAYRNLYLETCNHLYEVYGRLIPVLTEKIEKGFPKDPSISKVAYTAALRAKVLDCLRGLLPTSALTNMGVYGNGRFFESLIQRLNGHNLAELQEVGKKAYFELSKVIPSFIRRSEPSHRHQKTFSDYQERLNHMLRGFIDRETKELPLSEGAGVQLVDFNEKAPSQVAAALLFSGSKHGLEELKMHTEKMNKEELKAIFQELGQIRENRRHKSPRALEHATFTFEITADFGIYRDLQRHRMLTQERQTLCSDYGFYLPQEIKGTELEKEYVEAMERAKTAYEIIAKELPEEAQYVVPMAYNIRWYFHVNLRSLQWITELRSSPAGHPMYRYVAQEMAKQVCRIFPEFEPLFNFVDFEGYELGRLSAEIRTVEKLKDKKS